MKKIILIIVLIFIIIGIGIGVIILNENSRFKSQDSIDESNLQGKLEDGTEIIKFNDRLFLANLDDVYMNIEKYEGKIIQYTGFIHNIPDTDNFVVAREYFCCGFDASLVGFEAITDKKFKDDIWVTVTGKIVKSDKYEYVSPVMEVIDIVETSPGERYVYY